jgi:hypothetical protein
MLAELTREETAAALDQTAEGLLDEAGVRRPPVDAFAVARSLGITVAWDDDQEGRARYVRLAERWSGRRQATILLRHDPRVERLQWATAHEIGEHAAYRVFALLGADPRETPSNAREQTANSLAARILLPSAWFPPDAAESAWDLAALKARYSTASHELIARRMLDCGPSVVVSIFDDGRLTFRRSNVSGRVPPPLRAELECRRLVHEQCRAFVMRQSPCVVQGWPIHEDGWQREILRMTVEEEIAEYQEDGI